MKAPSDASLPPAVVAERERIIRWPYFKPERRAIIERLCNAKIWNQLSRHKPVMTRPRLIREWSWEPPDEKWSDRELALQLAFHGAFFIAISGIQTISRAETGKTVNFYREKAKQFQKEAVRLAET
jgi:hypothetical protein